MAKVILTIEDHPNGKVKCVATPTFEQMAMSINAGHELTSAEGYALAAINAIRAVSREQGNIIARIPRIGRP